MAGPAGPAGQQRGFTATAGACRRCGPTPEAASSDDALGGPKARSTRSSWCRGNLPSRMTLRCAICWWPKCCTARWRMRASSTLMPARRGAARRGGRANLAGYPAGGVFHRRAVRPDPRPAGYFLSWITKSVLLATGWPLWPQKPKKSPTKRWN